MAPVGNVRYPDPNNEREPLFHAIILDHCKISQGLTWNLISKFSPTYRNLIPNLLLVNLRVSFAFIIYLCQFWQNKMTVDLSKCDEKLIFQWLICLLFLWFKWISDFKTSLFIVTKMWLSWFMNYTKHYRVIIKTNVQYRPFKFFDSIKYYQNILN